MLTEGQARRIWERMIEAEVRALYFGELAARYTRYKQIISGASFFLSSGAAATLAAKAPVWLPLGMAAVTALCTAYAVAVGLDRRALMMSRLHAQWNHLAADYERLWHHWYEDDADEVLQTLLKRAREASELGSTEAPYDERLIVKWQDRVQERYGLVTV